MIMTVSKYYLFETLDDDTGWDMWLLPLTNTEKEKVGRNKMRDTHSKDAREELRREERKLVMIFVSFF